MNRKIGITYKPLKLFVSYVLFTLLVNFFGPLEYEGLDELAVSIYMLSFMILFTVGYVWGAGSIISIGRSKRTSGIGRPPKILYACISAAVMFKVIELILALISGQLNFDISSAGSNYVDIYADYERNTGSYSVQFLLSIVSTLPTWVALILGLFHFKQLPRKYRFGILFIIFVILLVNTISQGKQKQLGDIVLFVMSVGAIKVASGSIRIQKRTYVKICVLLGLSCMAFVYLLKIRYDAIGVQAFSYNQAVSSLTQLNLDHGIFSVFGYEWGFALAIFLSYFAGGYYGLSLSLSIPFQWTYFVGSSYSLMIIVDRFFGGGFILYDTYPLRMEAATGWDGLSKWHTIFPWLAGDYTFIGALVLFIPIARMYAIAWRESYLYSNPVSIFAFVVLTIGLVFVPANNQLFISPGSVITTVTMFIVWSLNHKKYNHPPRVSS